MTSEVIRPVDEAILHKGCRYHAQVCGRPLSNGTWEGWVEFLPLGIGDPCRSPRETTQPNRHALTHWAGTLTSVYLEGAAARACAAAQAVIHPVDPSPLFETPAPRR